MHSTMSITGSNVSNMLCEFNINMPDIINGVASNLMKIANSSFNVISDEECKCDIILKLTNFMYGLRSCGLSYENANVILF